MSTIKTKYTDSSEVQRQRKESWVKIKEGK